MKMNNFIYLIGCYERIKLKYVFTAHFTNYIGSSLIIN